MHQELVRKPCPTCLGEGQLPNRHLDKDRYGEFLRCSNCNGSGEVERFEVVRDEEDERGGLNE